MSVLVYLGLFLPLAGFLTIMAASNSISRKAAGTIACSTLGIAFICFSMTLFHYINSGMIEQSYMLYKWIPVEKIDANFTLYVDSISILMTLIITGVGFLIHLYSNGYMSHDEDYARYFACMNFFVFSMLLLVLAGDFVLFFVGWEGVGLASYLLIGFYYDRPAAAQAATKAFVINRIGDLGLLLGLLLTFKLFGTSNMSDISHMAKEQFAVGAPIITLLTLLYFVGATGKSAQIPLYTWLPDAMEGPTPVSALIHAATMVTAGVYLVVRMENLFLLSPITMMIVGIIGGVTSLYAAICAIGQTDLKRVLAYSTVSQLGLMFLACGTGAFYSAMFHLTAHAFIKALLFLSAGNIVHMMNGETEMAKMGGLAKIFKTTNWLFLLGVLALSGIPPFAAFFSKDLILEQEWLSGFHTLFYIGLAACILTGFYLTRAYCLTFLGPLNLKDENIKNAKEAPSIMLVPVKILAVLATIGGFLGFTFATRPLLEYFLIDDVHITLPEEELRSGFIITPETWFTVSGAILAVVSAYFIYTRYAKRLQGSLMFLKNSCYVNELYWNLIAQPLKAVAQWIKDVFEPNVIDQSVNGIVHATQGTASWFQRMQSGQIRSYVAWMVLGSVLLIAYFVVF
jgi:NADH-quinone oxidoreductase subunit L